MSHFINQLKKRIIGSRRTASGQSSDSVHDLKLGSIQFDPETIDWMVSHRAASGMDLPIDDRDMLLRAYIKYIGNLEGVRHYFVSGNYDADWILAVIDKHVPNKNPKVLEFASGFGRVGRFIKTKRPDLDFIASDIHPAAITFMGQKLGIQTELSSFEPEKLQIAKSSFDFVFVLSLFSHLPHESFARWLKAILALLQPNGILLFTTSGENSMEHQPHIKINYDPKKGYGYFGRDSDQPDLAASVYGTMAVDFEYVVRQIRAASDDIIVSYERGAWHPQDVWVIRRQ